MSSVESQLDMRPWQLGYSIEYLKSIVQKYYGPYNIFAASPFGKIKPNDVATELYKTNMKIFPGSAYCYKEIKKKTVINGLKNVPVGCKLPGELFFYNLALTPDDARLVFNQDLCKQKSVWLETWAENKLHTKIAFENGFKYAGFKVTTFGEIYSYYYRASPAGWRLSEIYPIAPPTELVNLKIIPTSANFDRKENNSLIFRIDNIGNNFAKIISKENEITFQNHYSNYNVKKSWSALSLRGYTSDIHFIEKPIEMNKKWHLIHANEIFFMQDTHLMRYFKEDISVILNRLYYPHMLEYSDIHRVRFMKLVPGGGELSRHTDQADPESYNRIGGLVRLHIPIITNDKVEFNSWNYKGEKRTINMKIGEIWMLDTRYPHSVINKGDTDRLHLVIDIKLTVHNIRNIFAS